MLGKADEARHTGAQSTVGDVETQLARLSARDGMVRQRARMGLVRRGRAGVPRLAELLASDQKRTRWEAAKALNQIVDPLAIPALLATLEDEDDDIRWLAAEALVKQGRAGLLAVLRSLQKRLKSHGIREGAYHVLHGLEAGPMGKPARAVIAALNSYEPGIEVPLAVHAALQALERDST